MDLSTRYLGLSLKNPVVASASPLSRTLEGIRQIEAAGAGAVVLFSLFEEQITREDLWAAHIAPGTRGFLEALRYYPDWSHYGVGADEYLDLVSLAKRTVEIPVIGSLNGASPGGWTRYARLIEGAGADALELNLYYLPADPDLSGPEVEEMYLDVVRQVKQAVAIPVAVKIGPHFSALPHMARRFSEAGADALVLFNRFYQPDFDLESPESVAHITLSRPEDLRLPLRWVALLWGRTTTDFAVTSGVHGHEDVLKAIMAGANVAMMASELLANGVGRIGEILSELRRWLQAHGHASLDAIRGSRSLHRVAQPAAFERAGYAQMLASRGGSPPDRFVIP